MSLLVNMSREELQRLLLSVGSRDVQVDEAVSRILGSSGPRSVDSTGDTRLVNNVVRHEYRVLSEDEKSQMRELKDLGLSLICLLHAIGGTDESGGRQASRELSLAQTKVEEAVMWGVKHVTS